MWRFIVMIVRSAFLNPRNSILIAAFVTIGFACHFPLSSHLLAAPLELTINTADQPPYSTLVNTGIYDKIVTKMFDKIGANIQINHLPSARSIENADLGIDDAEYARINSIPQHYKNLVLVDEKLLDYRFTGFSKGQSLNINGWSDLRQYHVGYIRGWKIYEKNVTEYKSLTTATTEEELFQLLLENRVDIILYEQLRGMDFLKRNNIEEIYPSKTPVAVKGMYLFLHKKHKDLAPQLSEILRTMKSTGEHQTILSEFN